METLKPELKTLMLMVSNWRRGYETWLTPGDNDYVFEEFVSDIKMHISPYVERLLAIDYITQAEGTEFFLYIMEQVDELKRKADEL